MDRNLEVIEQEITDRELLRFEILTEICREWTEVNTGKWFVGDGSGGAYKVLGYSHGSNVNVFHYTRDKSMSFTGFHAQIHNIDYRILASSDEVGFNTSYVEGSEVERLLPYLQEFVLQTLPPKENQ